jgi:hypothetical protein
MVIYILTNNILFCPVQFVRPHEFNIVYSVLIFKYNVFNA